MRYKRSLILDKRFRIQSTIRVDPDLWGGLSILARREGISKSDALELALRMFIDYEFYGILPGKEAQPTRD